MRSSRKKTVGREGEKSRVDGEKNYSCPYTQQFARKEEGKCKWNAWVEDVKELDPNYAD